jgi:U4/U6.U5 tri-snRNP-associated protein 1
MAEEERRQKNQELKVKKRGYTGYDDDEFVAGNEGMKRGVLAKYDEDIEGTKDTVRHTYFLCHSRSHSLQGFRLGSSVSSKTAALAEKEQVANSVNKSLLSIDYMS